MLPLCLHFPGSAAKDSPEMIGQAESNRKHIHEAASAQNSSHNDIAGKARDPGHERPATHREKRAKHQAALTGEGFAMPP